ncbi:MAG: metallophosphoesterase family protein [Phycisphaerae bacterium]|nr:metallophosphoesterase family protein [Phycisphaerae bacterium]
MKVEANSVRTRMCRLMMCACTALALGVCGAAQGQQPIAIGPYVQNVGSGNAIICWATLSGEVTIAPPAHRDTSFRDYQIHSVVLRGLKPGTTYTYSVPGDAGNTSLCSFTTCADEKHPFSFCVISDTQNRENQAHRLAIERMMADKPDMLFICGDLVADGRNIGDWEEFFRAEGDLLRGVPCYAVLGNHDRESPWYFRFFALPGNERYYSFDRGAAHFVVLDSPGRYMPEDNQSVTEADRERFERQKQQYWQEQMQWFKDDLSGHPDAKYIFVFLHYPIYCLKASRVESTNELRARFGTVFQDHRVTAVFSGHDHHYHREVAGGVHFVDGGVAGGKARPIDAPILPETVKHAAVESIARVEVGPDRAKVRVTDVAGNMVDEFELSPRPQSATRAQ